MSAQHTPGPWHLVSDHDQQFGDRFMIDTNEGFVTSYFTAEKPDARLIAAAPEMLERLKNIVEAARVGSASALEVWIKDTPALIAKAEGRS